MNPALPIHTLRASFLDEFYELDRGARRKVGLATNVAETSVTIPGISVVIDAGLVRQTRANRPLYVQRQRNLAHPILRTPTTRRRLASHPPLRWPALIRPPPDVRTQATDLPETVAQVVLELMARSARNVRSKSAGTSPNSRPRT